MAGVPARPGSPPQPFEPSCGCWAVGTRKQLAGLLGGKAGVAVATVVAVVVGCNNCCPWPILDLGQIVVNVNYCFVI